MKIINTFPKGFGFILFIFPFLFFDNAFAQGRWSGGWHMGPGMMGGWGMGWFGTIFMAVFWILILIGLIFFIRWLVQNTKRDSNLAPDNSSKAFDILKERYARGEINKDEFQEMKEALQS